MYRLDTTPTPPTLEHHLSLCSVYTNLSDHLDRFIFSVEHRDWKDASETFHAIQTCDRTLKTLTNESLELELPDLEHFVNTTESGFLSDTVTAFIDKIPGLIVKIALAVIAIIISLVVFLRKKSASIKQNVDIKPLSVKGYLGATTPEQYLHEFQHTQANISKLVHLLGSHVEGDLRGLGEAVAAASHRLVQYETWVKNPIGALVSSARDKVKSLNSNRLIKEYKKSLELTLSSLSGVYSIDVHEGRGVYIADPKSKMINDHDQSRIDNVEDVKVKVQKLRNANIDVLLTNFLIPVSLSGDHDRLSTIQLDADQVKHLYSIIDQTNHLTSDLLDKFESGITEVKRHFDTIANLNTKIDNSKASGNNRAFLREILDEVSLSSKAITDMIRDIQSLAIHLIIKY